MVVGHSVPLYKCEPKIVCPITHLFLGPLFTSFHALLSNALADKQTDPTDAWEFLAHDIKVTSALAGLRSSASPTCSPWPAKTLA